MGREKDTRYDVFISYRRETGAETAKHLRDTLTERGYRVFFDTDSLRSGSFNQALFDIVDACTDFIIILTPGSLDRCVNDDDWVRLELARAIEKGKNIVPVMSGGFQFPDTLPPDIDEVRWKNGIVVNVEYFDAMIDKLTSFLYSKPVGRKQPAFLALAALACLALVGTVAFFGLRGGGAQPSASEAPVAAEETSSKEDATPTETTTPAPADANPTLEKVVTDYTMGEVIDIYSPADGSLEYSIAVEDVKVLPDDFKKNMWEKYDEEAFDLLCVYCAIDNVWYHGTEKGALSHLSPLSDGAIQVKDADDFLLNYVVALYHGDDGKYLYQTGTSIPAGSKGRFGFIFYVEKGAEQVTLVIDSHDGNVATTTVDLT